MIRPAPLKKNACIGITAASSPVDTEKMKAGIAWLKEQGFKVKEGAHLYKSDRYLAGSDKERAEDLMALFTDQDVDAIFMARGGYGSPRILPLLDYDIIRHHAKPLVGFSDTTALQLALLAKSNLMSYTGFLPHSDVEDGKIDPVIAHSLAACLEGKAQAIADIPALRAKKAEGTLIGGCLSLIAPLCGTPYLPDMTGAILLIEEVKEEPYKIDRKLTQLRLAGVFDQVAGVILGDFKDCISSDPADGEIGTVLSEIPSYTKGPVLANFPYGHGPSRHVLTIGGRVAIEPETTLSCLVRSL